MNQQMNRSFIISLSLPGARHRFPDTLS